MAKDVVEIEADKRRPIRFLVRLGILAGLVYGVGRFLMRKKDEYAGLTESQARDKIVEKMSPRIGDDTAKEIADQVIPKLKDKGLIKEDPMEAAADDIVTAADEAVDAMEKGVADAADKVADAVDSAIKD